MNNNETKVVFVQEDDNEPPDVEPPLCSNWLRRMVAFFTPNACLREERDCNPMRSRFCGKFAGFTRII